jgi:hypothetical protein
VDSQEHSLFTTGMTNAGRTLGSPLGPDAWSLYGRGLIDVAGATLWPWVELAHFSSDVYGATENGPVVRVSEGIAEHRFRAGIDVRFSLRRGLSLQLQAFGERVGNADFTAGLIRFNQGLSATLRWIPGLALFQ